MVLEEFDILYVFTGGLQGEGRFTFLLPLFLESLINKLDEGLFV